ncbi:pre-toxin TG domain-containing protein [Peredibacter sp. HCB2-198]|uniref:pre-toxin TG domain-containing protein n=1 Tax=Peredibacter sp. HCB2-198 TaxID=3383025 RepID=UPI0038B63DF6
MRTIIALLFLVFSNLLLANSEVNILCTRLDAYSGCRLAYPDSNVMNINGNPILFNNGRNCSSAQCEYEGFIYPSSLRVGSNYIEFFIATITNDPNFYTKHRYDFFFNKKRKGEPVISERTGNNQDRTYQEIYLELKEINPKLHEELEKAKAEYRRLYDANFFEKIQNEENKIKEQQREIDQKIKEFEDLLAGMQDKQFDQIDAETLTRLDITQNQIQILRERKEELSRLQLNNSSNVRTSQTAIVNRYNTHRAKAREYGAYIPPLPAPQKGEDTPGEDVSVFVYDLIDNLNTIIRDHASALAMKDMDKLESSIKQWQERLTLVNDLLQTSRDLNSVEKQLLTDKTSEGYEILFKQGLTNDLWLKTNNIAETNRKFVDSLADQGNEAAKELKKNLNFTKVQPALAVKIDATLAKAETLSNKIDAFKPKDNIGEEAKKVAKATLDVGLESINDSILANDEESLKAADESISIGLKILDFGLNLVPVVSSVRPAYELFTGKNMVTQEELSTAEIAMASIEVIGGLTGFNVLNAVFSRTAPILVKIGKKISSPWSRLEVDKAFPQVENLIQSFKKFRRPVFEFFDSTDINKFISTKYPRFTDPAFKGRVLRRLSEGSEELCRVFTKFKLEDGKIGSTKAPPGVFTLRCADLIGKNLDAIKNMASIPDPKKPIMGYWVTKFSPPPGLTIYEGAATPLYGKKGNGIQLLIDTNDKEILESIEESIEKPISEAADDIFTGF